FKRQLRTQPAGRLGQRPTYGMTEETQLVVVRVLLGSAMLATEPRATNPQRSERRRQRSNDIALMTHRPGTLLAIRRRDASVSRFAPTLQQLSANLQHPLPHQLLGGG